MYQKHVNYDLRKYCFANRIITIWSCLPDNVVSFISINMCKNSLDQFINFCRHRMFILTGKMTQLEPETEVKAIKMLTSIVCKLVV